MIAFCFVSLILCFNLLELICWNQFSPLERTICWWESFFELTKEVTNGPFPVTLNLTRTKYLHFRKQGVCFQIWSEKLLLFAVNSTAEKLCQPSTFLKNLKMRDVKLNIMQSSLPHLSFQNGGFYCLKNLKSEPNLTFNFLFGSHFSISRHYCCVGGRCHVAGLSRTKFSDIGMNGTRTDFLL